MINYADKAATQTQQCVGRWVGTCRQSTQMVSQDACSCCRWCPDLSSSFDFVDQQRENKRRGSNQWAVTSGLDQATVLTRFHTYNYMVFISRGKILVCYIAMTWYKILSVRSKHALICSKVLSYSYMQYKKFSVTAEFFFLPCFCTTFSSISAQIMGQLQQKFSSVTAEFFFPSLSSNFGSDSEEIQFSIRRKIWGEGLFSVCNGMIYSEHVNKKVFFSSVQSYVFIRMDR